jgi:hypothetical protein
MDPSIHRSIHSVLTRCSLHSLHSDPQQHPRIDPQRLRRGGRARWRHTGGGEPFAGSRAGRREGQRQQSPLRGSAASTLVPPRPPAQGAPLGADVRTGARGKRTRRRRRRRRRRRWRSRRENAAAVVGVHQRAPAACVPGKPRAPLAGGGGGRGERAADGGAARKGGGVAPVPGWQGAGAGAVRGAHRRLWQRRQRRRVGLPRRRGGARGGLHYHQGALKLSERAESSRAVVMLLFPQGGYVLPCPVSLFALCHCCRSIRESRFFCFSTCLLSP